MTFFRKLVASSVVLVSAGAQAGVAIEGTGAGANTLTRTTAERFVVDAQGRGHIQLVPYYSTNNGLQTLVAITNEDEVNAKVIKVRFRSMGNSDTVFDLTLLLGPGDVWTANLSQGTSGKTRLFSSDMSCTLPVLSQWPDSPEFVTSELPPATSTFTDVDRNAWTREGFIEIINTGDVPPVRNTGNAADQTNPLFVAVTRSQYGNAPCGAALETLLREVSSESDAVAKGLDTPSGGLSTFAILIDTRSALQAWSIESTSLKAVTAQGKRARGRLVASPQTTDTVDVSRARALTSDPLLAQGRLTARQYHFPDLSTPYIAATTASTPLAQASHTGELLAVSQFSNQYSTLAAISSMTDFVVTEPMKRYFVGLDYAAASDADKLVIPVTNGFYGTPNTLVLQNRACYRYTSDELGWRAYDREGRKAGTGIEGARITGGVTNRTFFCGGSSVYGINSGPASTVLKSDWNSRLYLFTGFQEGWLRFDTPGAGAGMPVIGVAFTSAMGAPSNGVSTNYGWAVKHKGTPFER